MISAQMRSGSSPNLKPFCFDDRRRDWQPPKWLAQLDLPARCDALRAERTIRAFFRLGEPTDYGAFGSVIAKLFQAPLNILHGSPYEEQHNQEWDLEKRPVPIVRSLIQIKPFDAVPKMGLPRSD